MIQVSTRAADKLKEELVQKCLDAGIGFRITVKLNDDGKFLSTMKFDRQRQGDIVVDLGGVKLFSAESEVAQVKDYHLDYLEHPDVGFYLVKKPADVKIP